MTENLTPPAIRQNLESLLAVYTHARHYVLCRERAHALQSRSQEAPESLAEAIERDFIAFELEDAERALSAAVHSAEVSRGAGKIRGHTACRQAGRVS
ncbi:hypothetical protein E0493_06625 [Roseomonas sp. M0104]|uniref:Uncharacterized protein n=1 Tax=Teichococcus coralli TaxID=2545983 RepID=A0A845BCG2_9PROT|nr:hypothetical protein [Pseudoroseomonas coralli]MXP63027.1 hypothetical protein [Pseudoroseomonas coralli]